MYIVAIYHEGCPTSSLAVEPPDPNRSCSTCQTNFDKNDPKWIISRLPCPILERQKDTAGCIVIRPSGGQFRSYKIGHDLHIGISNSLGFVHSFWTKGIEIENSTWQGSVALLDLRPFFFDNLENLDNSIDFFVDSQKKTREFHKSKYREATWNCFDFVLEFLRFINFRTYSKLDFAEEFTTKKMQSVVKYCTLYGKLC